MNARLKTFAWLVKREFWEHKVMLVWAPLCVAAAMLVFLIAASAFSARSGVESFEAMAKENTFSSAVSSDQKAAAPQLSVARPQKVTAAGVFGFVLPLFVLLAITIFLYCVQTLYDERKNRSVLFWKSLPVSDASTVIAKVFTAAVAAPLFNLCVGLGISVVIALFFATLDSFAGQYSLWTELGKAEFYLLPVYFLAAFPVFVFWALPTLGWLMLVSSVARTTPLFWAVSIPILFGAIQLGLNQFGNFNWDLKWYWINIVGRGLGAVMPGSWYWPGDPSAAFRIGTPDAMHQMLNVAWAQFESWTMWVGIFAGVAMIYLAIQVRRWKDEG